MRVQAIRNGYYDFMFLETGTIFDIADEPKHDAEHCLSCKNAKTSGKKCGKVGKPECYSWKWMKEVPPETPATPTSAPAQVAGRKPRVNIRVVTNQIASGAAGPLIQDVADIKADSGSRKVI